MNQIEYRILLIDDEPDIIEFLSYNFIHEGYKVFTASDGKEGIDMAKKHHPHLIIIDVMMPEIDGIEACEQIRAESSLKNTVIVFLTARTEDYSQIAGFKAGADDYITKPIKLKVFMLRIKALLQRYSNKFQVEPDPNLTNIINCGNLKIDREKYTVSIEEKELQLAKKEFNLLLLLLSKPGKVFTRNDIFSQVWDNNVIVGARTIDVHIRKLREKIGNQQIVTIKGVGYKFIEF